MEANIWGALTRPAIAVPMSSGDGVHTMSRKPAKPIVPEVVAAKPKPKPPEPKLPLIAAPSEATSRGAINMWGLSAHQLRAADLLAHGADMDQIASTMCISRKTLDVHLYRARARMEVKTNAALVAAWFRVNLMREAEEARRLTNERLAAKLALVNHAA